MMMGKFLGRRIKLGTTVVLMLSLLFFGCDNLLEESDRRNPVVLGAGEARLILSVHNPANSRTAFPETLNFSSDMTLSFRLSGARAGGDAVSLKTWQVAQAGTSAYDSMTADNSLVVDTGTWSFTLEVLRQGAAGTEQVLCSKTISSQISTGANKLDFGTLEENFSTGTGALNVTLSFPSSSNVKEARGELYDSNNKPVANSQQELSVTSSADGTFSVTYSRSGVPSGTYWVRFSLTQQEDSTQVDWYPELVQVAANLTSSSHCKYNSLSDVYPIIFELEGGQWGTDVEVPGTYLTSGVTILPDAGDISKAGHTFIGWYEDDGAGLVASPVYAIASATGAKTFRAQWQANSVQVEALAPAYSDIPGLSAPAISGSNLSFISPAGYNKYKWFLDDTEQNPDQERQLVLDVNTVTPGIHSVALEVQDGAGLWYSARYDIAVYAINYNCNGGQLPESGVPKRYVMGMAITLPTNSSVTRTGYTFGGWYEKSDFSGNSVTTLAADATGSRYYHAKWTANGYTVQFNSNAPVAGTIVNGNMDSQDFTYGKSQTLPMNQFTCSGYIFTGWSTQSDGNGAVYYNGDEVLDLGSTTLYAQWATDMNTLFAGVTTVPPSTQTTPQDLTISGVVGEDYIMELRDKLLEYWTSGGNTATFNLDMSGAKIEHLPDNAFNDPTKSSTSPIGVPAPISSIILPPTLKSIGDNAFWGNVNLQSIDIPDTVTSIGSSAFQDTNLTEVNIPESVKSIGDFAFGYTMCDQQTGESLSQLATVTLNEGLEVIGSNAFNGCVKLTAINIPKTVTSIGSGAFSGTSLSTVTIPGSVKNLSGFDNCLSLVTVTLNEGLEVIGSNAFNGCAKLADISIPKTVTTIGSGAFSGTALSSVIIEEGVEVIGESAFESCSALTSVDIPDSVKIIGSKIFAGCTNLSSVTIGSGVEEMQIIAFARCTNLTTLVMNASTPPTLRVPDALMASMPDFKISITTVKVPAGCSGDYQNAEGWDSTIYNFTFEEVAP